MRAHRVLRRWQWLHSGNAWAEQRSSAITPHRIKRHNSLLLRQLGESEMWLQHTTFTLLVSVGNRYLEGELRADREPTLSYSVHARGEQFLRHQGRVFRRNEIWRDVFDRRTGNRIGEERLESNCALVVYEPDVEVIDV